MPSKELLNKIVEEDNDELFKTLRGFLMYGRILGVLPYQGIFSGSSLNLKFRWLSIASMYSCALICVLLAASGLELMNTAVAQRKNANDIAQSVRGSLYHIWVIFIYVSFLKRSKQFIKMFQVWKSTSLYFTAKDHKLKRDVVLISVIILLSAKLENSLLYMPHIKDMIQGGLEANTKGYSSSLKMYYHEFHGGWIKFLDFNSPVAVFGFVYHKFVLFSWNFMDILIALLGRALYFKFKTLCDMTDITLIEPLKRKQRFEKAHREEDLATDSRLWVQMTRDHSALCDLLDVFDNFLSPFIFLSITVNIFYLGMQLLDVFISHYENDTLFLAIYRPWSFAHLIMRIGVVLICCARVNLYAHEIRSVIHASPKQYYSAEVARLDMRVSCGRDIGLTGLNCFTINHAFILSIIGVIFTFEIVLLSVASSDNSQSRICCCAES